MASSDPQVALRKIDIVNWRTPVAQQFNIHSIPQVNVYNRGGGLVGTVLGADFDQVKAYVAQAKTGG
jgi:thioredoxin-like negative regulator of GroEL